MFIKGGMDKENVIYVHIYICTYIYIYIYTCYMHTYIHTMVYYAVLKEKVVLPFMTTWMDLESIK